MTAVLTTLLAGSTTAEASAQTSDDFAVEPVSSGETKRAFFAYDVRPGQVIEDKVRIANFADEPRTFQTYAADGYNTSDLGTFTLRSQDEPTVDVGSWVKLEVDQWTVPAQSQVDIPIRIEVPSNAAPGDHVGGIVALRLATTATDSENGVGLAVQNGIGARMYVQVEGPTRPELAIDDLETTYSSPPLPFGSGDATTTFRIANIGNVRLSPTVLFEATGVTGSIAEADLGEFPDLLPGSSVMVSHKWTGVPAAGQVTQSVELVADDVSYERSSSFWVFPWPMLFVGLAIAVAGFAVFRKRKGSKGEPDAAATSAGMASVVLLATIAFQVFGITSAGAGAAEPELVIRGDGTVQVDDPLVISGTDWPARNNVVIEVCGNQAQNGSQDCAVADGRTVATSSDGRFSTELRAAEPPTGCPCVVRARTVTGERTELAMPLSLELDGASAAGPAEAPVSEDAPNLSVSARVEDGSWRSWFALPSERTVVLTITNDGERAVDDAVASMAWGADEDPTGYLPLVSIDRIEPGQSVERRVEVPVEALAVGGMTLRGELSGVQAPIPFEATATTFPSGLLAIALALAAVLGVVGVRRLSRRSSSRAEPVAAPVEAWATTDLSVDEEEEDGLEGFARWIEELQPASLAEDRGPQPAPVPMLLSDVDIDLTGAEPVVRFLSESASVADASPEVLARPESDEIPEPVGGRASGDGLDAELRRLGDPFESDITLAVAATAALADRIRRETDSALLDHHEASRELADRLRRESEEEILRLASDAESEKRMMREEAANAKEFTESLTEAASERVEDVLQDLAQLHDESVERLDQARQDAERLISEATARSEEIERKALETLERAEQIARSMRAEAEQAVAEADQRVAETTASIERRAGKITEEATARAEQRLADAEAREEALRERARSETADIIKRGAEDIVQSVLNQDRPIYSHPVVHEPLEWPRVLENSPPRS